MINLFKRKPVASTKDTFTNSVNLMQDGFTTNAFFSTEVDWLAQNWFALYISNPIANACINMIVAQADGIKLNNFGNINRDAYISYLVWGNAFLVINLQDVNTKPLLLPYTRISIDGGSKGYYLDGALRWDAYGNPYNEGDGFLLHLKRDAFNNNSFLGYSALVPAYHSILLHNEIINFTANTTKNGGRISGIATINKNLTEEKSREAREIFSNALKKAKQTGDTLFLDNVALDYKSLAQHNNRDLDAFALLNKTEQAIALTLQIPLPLIDNSSSTFNNLTEASKGLWNNAVSPLLEDIVNQINLWLYSKKPLSRTTVSINKSTLPLTVQSIFYDSLKTKAETNTFTLNELRSSFNATKQDLPQTEDELQPLRAGNIILAGGQIIPVDEDLGADGETNLSE